MVVKSYKTQKVIDEKAIFCIVVFLLNNTV